MTYCEICENEEIENAEVLATDTTYKAVDFIETYTGRAFLPRSPRVEDFSIIDIAHHLSNDCRYSGATMQFYSTAQHCCLLSDYVRKERNGSPQDCLQMLMHDGAEAYLRDIPRPIKQHLPEYRKWDYTLTMAMRSWLGLDGVPIPIWQDELDSRIIADERLQLMSDSGLDWKHDVQPLDIVIEPWTARYAEQEFLQRYSYFMKEITGRHQYLRSGWGVPTHSIFTPQGFLTRGSDTAQRGPTEPHTITDLIEVDFRGGVGRVVLRSPNGMMMRDTCAGQFPRPAWQFIHGSFTLLAQGEQQNDVG